MINLILSLYYLLMAVIGFDPFTGFSAVPGYEIQALGRAHMSPSSIGGCTPNYNSRPATSGCHHPSILEYTIYDEPQPDQNLVHNLEHGAVIIYVQESALKQDEGLFEQLSQLVTELKEEDHKYCRLILTPLEVPFSAPTVPQIADVAGDMKIALTAWTWLDMMEELDRERIIRFINTHINQGPESFVNDCR